MFCSACDDVVYDPRLEYVLAEEQHRSHVARPNEATLDAVQALDATCMYASQLTGAATQGVTLPGICRVPRGLRNMGATCFLNVILQAFLHNPLLRNFFLSDRHNASLCAIGRDCLACEMDKLYAEVCRLILTPSFSPNLPRKDRMGPHHFCTPSGSIRLRQNCHSPASMMHTRCLSVP